MTTTELRMTTREGADLGSYSVSTDDLDTLRAADAAALSRILNAATAYAWETAYRLGVENTRTAVEAELNRQEVRAKIAEPFVREALARPINVEVNPVINVEPAAVPVTVTTPDTLTIAAMPKRVTKRIVGRRDSAGMIQTVEETEQDA